MGNEKRTSIQESALKSEQREGNAHCFLRPGNFIIVHHEYVPQDRTINREYYLKVLKRLHDTVRRKRPHLWKSGNWLLHHDNAPAHSSHLIQQFLTKLGIVQLCQSVPPYSPDIASCDFWLFPKLKHQLKGKRFDEEIKQNTTRKLLAITKNDF